MMKKILILFSMLMFGKTGFAQAGDQNDPQKKINAVITTFMQSIIKKDTTDFLKLFTGEKVGWSSIMATKTYEGVTKTSPKTSLIFSGDPKSFIRWISKDSAAMEERFFNIKISTDNTLASVSFDYGFYENGVEMNWGQEDWELFFTGTDWKITGVYWSENDEQISPDKRGHW